MFRSKIKSVSDEDLYSEAKRLISTKSIRLNKIAGLLAMALGLSGYIYFYEHSGAALLTFGLVGILYLQRAEEISLFREVLSREGKLDKIESSETTSTHIKQAITYLLFAACLILVGIATAYFGAQAGKLQ